jgi:polyvinyl alcohol dehydrogenase (cytochrome)
MILKISSHSFRSGSTSNQSGGFEMRRFRKFSHALMATFAAVLLLTSTVLADGGSQWPFAGSNVQNTRYQDSSNKISPANAGSLTEKWHFATDGDVSATPAVDGNTVYVPDAAGKLYAVNGGTGALIWSSKISNYTGLAGDYARTTPAIAGNRLIFGDQAGRLGNPAGPGAYVMAVNKNTGALLWKTLVETHPFAMVTQSAVVHGNDVYVGVSSFEELFSAVIPGYACCSFRGSVLKLDANTGAIQWKTYTVPVGYSGGAVWGSTPAIDPSRKSVFVSTGNNYSVPATVSACVVALGANPDPAAVKACISPDNHFDSVMALDLRTGAVKWATSALPIDAWNVNCAPGLIPGIPGDPSLCPNPIGPDYDFGQGPALFTTRSPQGEKVDFLGVGQKSSQYWALNPDTGAVVWVTKVGPGGVGGGLQWGSATDGSRIYVAEANSESKSWTLQGGATVTSGFWSALDARTGAILWQKADPQGAGDPGAVSGGKGVVYGCSSGGKMHALNAATGAILWSYDSGKTCYAGAAISNSTVYWGTGYNTTTASKLFAFGLP